MALAGVLALAAIFRGLARTRALARVDAHAFHVGSRCGGCESGGKHGGGGGCDQLILGHAVSPMMGQGRCPGFTFSILGCISAPRCCKIRSRVSKGFNPDSKKIFMVLSQVPL